MSDAGAPEPHIDAAMSHIGAPDTHIGVAMSDAGAPDSHIGVAEPQIGVPTRHRGASECGSYMVMRLTTGRECRWVRHLRECAVPKGRSSADSAAARVGESRPRPRPPRETGACLDVAEALGYVERVSSVLGDRRDHARGTLVKVVV
ncbi:MAG TPA: hypothetical protein VHV30_11365 [Polyangiaceae bacterium]|jgi:hypothetical protein|nr:hypothetical protein [Polyangiaceae bacterium]